jgi:integrase
VPIKDRSITLEAALLFFQCCRDPYKDLALFQYFSASRISEAAGLQWSRVDFENKRITIMETSSWDSSTKLFVDLNPFPKNRTPRFVYMTAEIEQLLKRRKMQAIEGNNFVFHIEGKPLHYCNIQINYRHAQRTAQIPFRGTHILRHGMAKLARKVGGGLDAVIAMTGHKDFKLADHYSKLDSDYQKEISMKIMDHIRDHQHSSAENIISIANYAKAK